MKNFATTFLIIVLTICLRSLTANADSGLGSDDKTYTTSDGKIKFNVPNLLFGQKVKEIKNNQSINVKFMNDAGSLMIVDVISEPDVCPFDKLQRKRSLQNCLSNYITAGYNHFSKESKRLQYLFETEVQRGIIVEEWIIPGGSTIQQFLPNGKKRLLDSIRIAMAFELNGKVIIVQYDPGFPPGLIAGDNKNSNKLELKKSDRQVIIDVVKSVHYIEA